MPCCVSGELSSPLVCLVQATDAFLAGAWVFAWGSKFHLGLRLKLGPCPGSPFPSLAVMPSSSGQLQALLALGWTCLHFTSAPAPQQALHSHRAGSGLCQSH